MIIVKRNKKILNEINCKDQVYKNFQSSPLQDQSKSQTSNIALLDPFETYSFTVPQLFIAADFVESKVEGVLDLDLGKLVLVMILSTIICSL